MAADNVEIDLSEINVGVASAILIFDLVGTFSGVMLLMVIVQRRFWGGYLKNLTFIQSVGAAILPTVRVIVAVINSSGSATYASCFAMKYIEFMILELNLIWGAAIALVFLLLCRAEIYRKEKVKYRLIWIYLIPQLAIGLMFMSCVVGGSRWPVKASGFRSFDATPLYCIGRSKTTAHTAICISTARLIPFAFGLLFIVAGLLLYRPLGRRFTRRTRTPSIMTRSALNLIRSSTDIDEGSGHFSEMTEPFTARYTTTETRHTGGITTSPSEVTWFMAHYRKLFFWLGISFLICNLPLTIITIRRPLQVPNLLFLTEHWGSLQVTFDGLILYFLIFRENLDRDLVVPRLPYAHELT